VTGIREAIFLLNGPRTNSNDKLTEEQDWDMMLLLVWAILLGTLNWMAQFQEQGYSLPYNSFYSMFWDINKKITIVTGH